MNNKKIVQLTNNSITGYSLAFLIGLAIGLSYVPDSFVGILYIVAAAACLLYALQGNIAKVFSLLPYIVYSEIYVRGNIHFIPYLFAQYLLIAVFLFLILRQGNKAKLHSLAFIFIIFFAVIEIVDSARAIDYVYARGLVVNTLAVTVIVTWASFNFLVPALINKFLDHLKFASIYLCGIVLAAHFTGHIDYGLTSNSESTNGLAPVQISGYLGFSCFVFFLSVMSDEERKDLVLNLLLLAISSAVMLLSFSRGGLYFLGIMITIYLFFNRRKVKNYFLLFLLIPVAIAVYYYVTVSTNGLIEERYAEQGTSGRDELLKAGYNLFITQPLTGVGTGNFNLEITNQHLYDTESGAHNEFIRAAAEHGLAGIITYWGFFVSLIFGILKRKKIQREYALYFAFFFILITIHNGLKISLQPLLLLFAVATPSLIKIKKKINVSAQNELAL
ncbi:MAG: O-antigen ligase family protein [Chitinophagaceae bacterium]